MNLKFFAAAAAVSLCAAIAAPAFAGDGTVEGDYLNIKTTSGGRSTNGWQIGANYNTAPSVGSFGVQGDVVYIDGTNVANEYISAQATGFEQLKSGRIGVYGNYTDAFGDNDWDGGAVGQAFGNKFTLTGLVGAGQNTTASVGYWLAGAEASWYFMPNLALRATYSYSDTYRQVGSVAELGGQIEWKPEMSPVSFQVGYANQNPAGPGRQQDILTVGLRFMFGAHQSLKDRDQTGVINDFGLHTHL